MRIGAHFRSMLVGYLSMLLFHVESFIYTGNVGLVVKHLYMVHLHHLCIPRKGDKNGDEERYRTDVVL
jgi:hypothetical protein